MVSSWASVGNLPGGFAPDVMLLLTDGDILIHNANNKDWRRLTPDVKGKYESGTWTGPFNMVNTRQWFASGILMNGSVFAVGGEYSDAGNQTPLGEIFDPVTNSWSAMNKPATFNWIKSDAVSCIIADGRVLFGSTESNRTAIWDPVTDTWTEAGKAFGASAFPTKAATTDEETWTLLQDGTVLAVEIFNPTAAEKYVPSLDQWVSAGNTPSTIPLQSLFDPATKTNIGISGIGPALVLPDGRAFFVGGTGHTALYTPPPNPSDPGRWTAGPDTPADTDPNKYNQINGNLQTALDAPGCLLPNGKVLLVTGNTVLQGGSFWSRPANFSLYDPATNLMTPFANPTSNQVDTWQVNLLLLPTGQVLFASQQASLEILTVDPATSAPNNAWRPTITSFPNTIFAGQSYQIAGTQLNGLSQACSYGDDAQMATNYPIIRLTDNVNGNVFYLRTFDFSTLGIATGNSIASATVQVPTKVSKSQYSLVVIANGISSNPMNVNVITQDCFILVDRSTFGQGEIQSLINDNGAPAVIDPALYVVLEGYTPNELKLNANNLGNPPIRPNIPSPTNGLTLEFSGPVIPEDPSLPNRPQRFTFSFKATFQNTNMFNFVPDIEPLTLTASHTVANVTTSCSASIELIKNPNPFILHGDTAHGYPWYLSVDLRVFQMKANQTKFGVTVGAGAAADVATTFIQRVLTNLNGSPGSAGGLFDALPQAEDTSSLALAPTDTAGVPVYNFGLARVRYRDIIPTNNVRVFFRMWPGAQINASYNESTLYRTQTNPGNQKIPLLGVIGTEIVTIPFFASKRVDTTSVSMITQTDLPNVQPTITPSALGELDIFYGCWLDINQPNDQRFPSRLIGPNPANLPDGPFTGMGPLLSIQQLVRSQHQCLLAEIAFDPDPIVSFADPSNSDKLAQRNLTFVNVPNPGLFESRRALQVMEIRPTPKSLGAVRKFDELMIEWGKVPDGSTASIYLPAVGADQVLKLAGQMYASHRLSKFDEHTVTCPAAGVTFIPVLPGSEVHFTGLVTLDFPHGIKAGQEFGVLVKQVTRAYKRVDDFEIPSVPNREFKQDTLVEDESKQRGRITRNGDLEWRRVLGTFKMKIPVSTKEALLAPEERLLSVLRWIEQSISPDSRWYLVFQRYVEQVAGRVQGMGGDPTQIFGDPNGKGAPDPDEEVSFCGRICGIIYNGKGCFTGFKLHSKSGGEKNFQTDECELEKLVERAWAQKVKVTVCTLRRDQNCVVRVVLQEPTCRSRSRGRTASEC